MDEKRLNESDNSQPVPEFLSLAQATELIVESARHLVNKLIENRGHDKPPFLSAEFARLQGINKIVKADLRKTSALLLRFPDGYMIKVNQNHNLARQNFSCAHEIGHTLFSELKLERYIHAIEVFSELKLERYKHTIEYRDFNPSKTIEARAAARERLCDAAAAELLMPEFVFRKYLSSFGLSISSVEHLANIFRVSILSAAIRIAEVSSEPCLALLWQSRSKNEPKGLRLAWSIGPGRKSRGKNNYMPVHTLVRDDSTLYKAYQSDSLAKSSKDFKLDNIKKRLPMESKRFGYGATKYVISLAFLDR